MGTGTNMGTQVRVRGPILGMGTGTNFGYQMGTGTKLDIRVRVLKWVPGYEYGYQSGYGYQNGYTGTRMGTGMGTYRFCALTVESIMFVH